MVLHKAISTRFDCQRLVQFNRKEQPISVAPLTVIVVLDGLRPTAIDPVTMPFVHRMQQQGVCYQNAYAAFPSLTRANAATLATGQLPDRTGIWGNLVWHPDLGFVDTSDVGAVARLRAAGAMAQPSLAEHLSRRGRSVLVVGNGSPGCTLLLNPGAGTGHGLTIASTGPTGDAFAALPPELSAVIDRLGPVPTPADASLSWASAAASAAIQAVAFDVLIFWSGQPDVEHHDAGPAAPSSRQVLRHVDDALEQIYTSATAAGRACNLIVTSDHGFCETIESVDLDEEVERIGIANGLSSRDVVIAANEGAALGYFHPHVSLVKRRRYIEAVVAEAWAGPLFCQNDVCAAGAFPMSLVSRGEARFTPDLIITARTNGAAGEPPNDNARAWQLRPRGGTPHRGVHGSLHPQDLRIPLVLHGPAFAERARPGEIAGMVDIAPTVFALLTGDELPGADGRVLTEALVTQPFAPAVPPPSAVIRVRRGIHELSLSSSQAGPRITGAAVEQEA